MTLMIILLLLKWQNPSYKQFTVQTKNPSKVKAGIF